MFFSMIGIPIFLAVVGSVILIIGIVGMVRTPKIKEAGAENSKRIVFKRLLITGCSFLVATIIITIVLIIIFLWSWHSAKSGTSWHPSPK